MAKQIDEARSERLERARLLVEQGAYIKTGQVLFVYADSPRVAGYDVIGGRCGCADARVGFAARFGVRCKHECVWDLVTQAEREQREQSALRPPADLGPFKAERAPRRLPRLEYDQVRGADRG